MLQIKDIKKQYVTGELVQTALDGVSLNLRDNEFVAILGPSGSGKTTLLNVIGGLDRYDSGDLIINGVSTKKYTDRDWDSYRNHTIGFVFQSYNLIPHQSVLANVELALTISGISRAERRRRAVKALEDVGLGNQLHKRPNQMSGGQMQRVAIARALVNNPDILLADEPTGALDSETSVQIMNLLKEVARDRLVVMVTHNPELAEEYANRIVRVKDGRIIGDTNPFVPDAAAIIPAQHKNMGKASMSFLTALALSFNNLRTKAARTLLTAFAGSIGIIGIALIMSLSTGFQNYIDKIQEDTLSNYPLTIQSEAADMTTMMTAMGTLLTSDEELEDGVVEEVDAMTQMFSRIGTNDIASFKAYLEENYGVIGHTINTIKYSYGVKPRIFSADTSDGAVQLNPGALFGSMAGSSMMTSYMSADMFQEMIDNIELLESQYDVLEGRWPERYDEMIIVLQDPRQMSDYMAYGLGLKDQDVLTDMITKIMQGEEAEQTGEKESWTYEELMALEYRLVDPSDLYRYNSEYNVWEDMSDDKEYVTDLVENGEVLRIVGIVCPKEGVNTMALSAGVAYTSDLTRHVIERAGESEIVRKQLEDEEINVFTGVPFDEENEIGLDFENMISVDGNAISSAFGMNISTESIMSMLKNYLNEAVSSMDVDTAPAQNAFISTLSDMGKEMLNSYISANADSSGTARLYLTEAESVVDSYLATSGAQQKMSALASRYGLTTDAFRQVYRPLLQGMVTGYIAADMSGGETETAVVSSTSFVTLTGELTETTAPAEDATVPEETAAPEVPAETTEPTESTDSTQPEGTEATDPTEVPDVDIDINTDQFSAAITAADVDGVVNTYTSTTVVTGTASVMGARMMESTVRSILTAKVAEFGKRLASFIGSSMTVDTNKISSAFQFNMTEAELQRLMAAMSGQSQETTALSNLQTLGYADLDEPISMYIYLIDFAGKEEFIDFLDDYNDQMEAAEQEDKVIRYTDVTGIMMSSVRTIIDSVSYALIAFVAVSLVVSSIMIGIITYISVMERTKEIGVLRAIGASKRNITQVFNAETFIIGLCSGLIGIGITLLVLIPGNQLIWHLTNNPDIVAQLPVVNALALIGLSMVLTLIGGFIPAKHAAKKDPVIALRTE